MSGLRVGRYWINGGACRAPAKCGTWVSVFASGEHVRSVALEV